MLMLDVAHLVNPFAAPALDLHVHLALQILLLLIPAQLEQIQLIPAPVHQGCSLIRQQRHAIFVIQNAVSVSILLIVQLVLVNT